MQELDKETLAYGDQRIVKVIVGAAGMFIVAFAIAYVASILLVQKHGRHATSLSSLKMLAPAAINYTSQFDEKFPLDMASARAAEPALIPFAKFEAVFKSRNPAGGEILGNSRLSGKDSSRIVGPSKIVMFHDSLPWNGTHCLTAYTDGHVKMAPSFSDVQQALRADPFAPAPK